VPARPHLSNPIVHRPRIDEIDVRLWEISENLHRAELSTLERSEQIAEWVTLTEAKPSEAVSALVGQKLSTRGRNGEGRPEGGVAAAAREIGVSRQGAERAAKIAGISDDAKDAAKAAGIDDNQSALLRAHWRLPTSYLISDSGAFVSPTPAPPDAPRQPLTRGVSLLSALN